ncbi:endolytic transglycosylase MltG [Limimaricola cinnabarinus]|uniref:Endolytic murein transglycosylase n=1 Tax=Limimaricola cinnabarinus LL-001 TaxID=1337093 RepID=U2YKY2_9RHOB|nr:endolytic transglycosylase MltG [Limimaricola cinnabarinus]GAD55681.1 protein YceG like [Limimaricola cinnabarinus LL-001]
MWRHLASNTITFLIVGLAGAAGVIAWGVNAYSDEGPLEAAICLRVEPGTNMRSVSARLEEQGAIGSASVFRIGAEYSEKAGQLKAGSHLIPERSSMSRIVDIVTRGGASTCGTEILYKIGVNAVLAEVRELDPATSNYTELAEFDPTAESVKIPAEYQSMRARADTRYRISMAEGVTSWQVVNALNALDTLEGDVEEIPAEGSLAPDSYEIAPGTQVGAVLDRMAAAQAAILAEAWENRAGDLPLETPEEALILASIVEKETGVGAERPQVASVFVNRLRQGMRLQTDPTVIYGITEGEGVLGRGLRQSELRAETPWNTYVINGLPPTPIANPGRAAIEAALNPATTDYVFFVADGTGGHAFAETLAEHNSNVAVWRKIEAERAAAQN